MNIKEIGKRIKEIRKSIGMEQKDLAKLMDVSLTTTSNWETGNKKPSTEKLILLAELGKKSIDWLINGQEKPPSFIDARHLPSNLQSSTTEIKNKYQADSNDKDKENFFKKAAIHFEELFDWIYEDIGQDAKSIRKGFRIVEESCADFRRWRYNFDETKKQNGTDN